MIPRSLLHRKNQSKIKTPDDLTIGCIVYIWRLALCMDESDLRKPWTWHFSGIAYLSNVITWQIPFNLDFVKFIINDWHCAALNCARSYQYIFPDANTISSIKANNLLTNIYFGTLPSTRKILKWTIHWWQACQMFHYSMFVPVLITKLNTNYLLDS